MHSSNTRLAAINHLALVRICPHLLQVLVVSLDSDTTELMQVGYEQLENEGKIFNWNWPATKGAVKIQGLHRCWTRISAPVKRPSRCQSHHFDSILLYSDAIRTAVGPTHYFQFLHFGSRDLTTVRYLRRRNQVGLMGSTVLRFIIMWLNMAVLWK